MTTEIKQERNTSVQQISESETGQRNNMLRHWYDAHGGIMQYCLEREAEWARG
jgi:hypothetical protein